MAEVRLVKNPFNRKCDIITIKPGMNLQETVDGLDIAVSLKKNIKVFRLDDNLEIIEEINRDIWPETYLKENEKIKIIAEISGGGGGGGKQILTIVAMVALAFVVGFAAGALIQIAGNVGAGASLLSGAAYTGAMGAGVAMGTTSAIWAAVGGVASLAMSALIKPPSPKTNSASWGESMRSLSNSSNQMSPYSPLPRIYGKTRFCPYKVAPDYTEIIGNDTYLRSLFCFGYGPLKLSDIKIGTNPISNYTEVEMEIREGWEDDKPITLYTNTARTSNYNILLKRDTPVITTSLSDVDEISFDIQFPLGIWAKKPTDGSGLFNGAYINIGYRKVGDEDWIWLHKPWTLITHTTKPFTRSFRIKLPEKGQYEVYLHQYYGLYGDDGTNAACHGYLTTFRNIEYKEPVRAKGLCLMAIRVKATDQLNGTLDNVSALCESYEKVFTDINQPPQWKLNRHPAWHVYDILTGTACVSPLKDEQIDIQSLIDWEKTYPNWLVDVAIDGDFTRLDCIQSMCSAGKAFFSNINGKYCTILDKAGKQPVAAISPRNSFGFSFSKSFEKDIHGFKVKYIDPDRDWTEQEVIVYNTGYNKDNATEFEALDSYGCTDRTRAWKYGKYMLSQYVLRPETYTVSQDIENLAVNLGDLVYLSNDVIKVGVGSARIKSIDIDDNNRVAAITLDDKFYLPNSSTYAMIIRSSFGALQTFAIESNEEPSDYIVLTNPIPESIAPQGGEMVYIGETDRTHINAIVQEITPGDDLTATITLVPEAPEIHDETEADIPDYDPEMSDIPNWIDKAPLSPIVENIIADERALIPDSTGGYKAAVAFTVRVKPEETVAIDGIQVYTQNEGNEIVYRDVFPYTGLDDISISKVENGVKATIKVRYISKKGVASDWTQFSVLVEGTGNPPPDVENLDRQGYNITWNYDNKPLDFAGFRIYYNYGNDPWKEHAVKAHTQSLWDSPPFTTATLPKEQLTLFVVAVDTAGNESVNPAIITFYNGDIEYDNILQEYDYKENDYPGIITDGYKFDGSIFANEDQLFYSPDNQKFYNNDDELFYRDINYAGMVYEFNVEYIGDIENAYVKLDYNLEGIYKIYYRRESKEPFYPDINKEFYSAEQDLFYKQDEHWYLMPDKLLIQKERITIRIIFEAGKTQGVIHSLKATIDAPDVSELLSGIDISASGTRLIPTKNFKVINKVFTTLLGGSEAISAKVVDMNIRGPMIQCFDKDGNPVAATINADIRGYK